MSPPVRMDPVRVDVLRALLELAVGEGGYLRARVRGWARSADVAERIGRPIPERLPALHRLGLVDRRGVPGARGSRPVWLYRITQQGADRLAERQDTPAARIAPPRPVASDEPRICLPRSCVDLLSALCELRGGPASAQREGGESGWALAIELQPLVIERGRGRRFFPEDLGLLRDAGLVERTEEHRPGGGRPRVLYRATPAGLRARVLDWREPDPSPAWAG
jgi:DNA-binding PadR family transcriptional regulator